MKILIGTPVHESKDYSMQRWLKSVSEIKVDKNHQWRLFMVDNSQNPDYWKRVDIYCKALNFVNYDLIHLNNMVDDNEHIEERLGNSREEIKQKLLKENWDYWFSWECDIICPSNILSVFTNYSKDCDIVGHTYPLRKTKNDKSTYIELESIGLMLFPKKFFKDYGFTKGLEHTPGDGPIIHRIVEQRWKWISLHNCLPVEHLNWDG